MSDTDWEKVGRGIVNCERRVSGPCDTELVAQFRDAKVSEALALDEKLKTLQIDIRVEAETRVNSIEAVRGAIRKAMRP